MSVSDYGAWGNNLKEQQVTFTRYRNRRHKIERPKLGPIHINKVRLRALRRNGCIIINVELNRGLNLVSADDCGKGDTFGRVSFLTGYGEDVWDVCRHLVVEFHAVGYVVCGCGYALDFTRQSLAGVLLGNGAYHKTGSCWSAKPSWISQNGCSPKVNIQIPSIKTVNISDIILNLQLKLELSKMPHSQRLWFH